MLVCTSDFSIIEKMNPVAEVIDPQPGIQTVYDRIYPVFEAAYQALVPIYDQIAGLEAG